MPARAQFALFDERRRSGTGPPRPDLDHEITVTAEQADA